MSTRATWSSLVLAGTISAGACGEARPRHTADPAPVPVTPPDAVAAIDAVAATDAVAAIDAALPPGLDVALDGEAVCINFRHTYLLVVGTAGSRLEAPMAVHMVDTRTGTVSAPIAADECSMTSSPDDKLVLATEAGAETTPSVEIRDAATRKRRSSFSPWPKRVLGYDTAFILRARFFPDGDRIALLLANDTPIEATLAIWSTKRKRIVAELPMSTQPIPESPTSHFSTLAGEALAISRDGRYVAAGNLDPAVHVFDLAQGNKELVLVTSLDTVSAIAFAPDGKWLAATGKGGTMTTFELPSGKQLARAPAPPECGAAAVSSDGQLIAIGCKSDVHKNDSPVYPAPRGLRIYTVSTLPH